jgi:hypothetical protein
MTDAPAPAGSPEQLLLEALARHYGPAEFSAQGRRRGHSRHLWQAAGVARPDPAAVGRWLRVRKGVVAGHVLAHPEEPARRRPVAAAAGRAAQAGRPNRDFPGQPRPRACARESLS